MEVEVAGRHLLVACAIAHFREGVEESDSDRYAKWGHVEHGGEAVVPTETENSVGGQGTFGGYDGAFCKQM